MKEAEKLSQEERRAGSWSGSWSTTEKPEMLQEVDKMKNKASGGVE